MNNGIQMQQVISQEKSGNEIVVELVDNRPKLTSEELKLLWMAIESGQNMGDLCRQCGKPCGKIFSSEHSCELMIKLKGFSE